jgi:nucleotide-binding universal stress UspA family protein
MLLTHVAGAVGLDEDELGRGQVVHVLEVRRMTLPRTILVATDFSEYADAALAYAAELAAQLDATIHLVHAITIPVMGITEMGLAYASLNIESVTKAAQNAMDARVMTYRDRVSLAPTRLEVGDARDVIDRVAEQIGADLVVIGTHGRRGVRRVLLGSVAESVVRSAPCPVLTVRAVAAKR